MSAPPAEGHKRLWVICVVVGLLALVLLAKGKNSVSAGNESGSGKPSLRSEIGDSPKTSWSASGHKVRQIASTLDFVLENPELNDDMRNDALASFASNVESLDLPAVLEALKDRQTPGADELRRLLARRWAENDPGAARLWAMQTPEGPQRRDALLEVTMGWAASDASGALAWLNSLPDIPEQQNALVSLAYELARTDPVSALNVAAQMPPSPERDQLLVYAVSQWAGNDPAIALEWAAGISDPTLRQKLLSSASVAAAELNPGSAATLAAASLQPGDDQNRAVVGIVQRWAQTSPLEAAAWVAAFPDTPARSAAVENLVQIWAAQDSPATAAWLNALPQGPLRADGLAAFPRFQLPQAN